MIKDITYAKVEGQIMDEFDETLSVFLEGAPKKKQLNTLLGGNQNDEDEENESDEERNSSTNFDQINIRVNAHKKFDIKQLKSEIWKIIETKGIPHLDWLSKERKDDKKDFSFTDLMITFGNHIENKEMLECLSVH